MSRRANILLLFALGIGVAYGRLAVPFLLPMLSDAIVEESEGQARSEADELRFRMLSLKSGMAHAEVERVFGLVDKHVTVESIFYGGLICSVQIDREHVLRLTYHSRGFTATRLVTAELHDGEQVLARMPAAQMIPGK